MAVDLPNRFAPVQQLKRGVRRRELNMNGKQLLILATLSFCLWAVVAAQIQPTVETSRSYLRATIKAFPAAEGQPLLQYLDAGRVAADKGIQFCAEGKMDALYESMSADFKNKYSLEQFRQVSQMFEQKAGKITSYEYRNQALSYPIDDTPLSELAKAKSNVWYAIKTTKLSGEGNFMQVKTVREGNKHIVSFINFVNYGDNIPPWLTYPDAPSKRK
jgi:hypothetical protein